MIRMTEDVVGPGIAAAIDQVSSRVMPDWHRWVILGATALGYGGAMLDMGGSLVKEIGKASLPLAVRELSDMFAGGASARVGANRMAFRPAQRVARSVSVPAPGYGADQGI